MGELAQFCILAQSQKGRACAALIEQALNNKRMFNFDALLAVSSVSALLGSDYDRVYQTLHLFAFGSYEDYLEKKSCFLDLSPSQTLKLKQLSLLSILQKKKIASFDLILSKLRLSNRKEVEELVVESIISGLLLARIDQINSLLHIYFVHGRSKMQNEEAFGSNLWSWQSFCLRAAKILEDSVVQRKSELTDKEQTENMRIQSTCEIRKKSLKEAIDSTGEVLDFRRK